MGNGKTKKPDPQKGGRESWTGRIWDTACGQANLKTTERISTGPRGQAGTSPSPAEEDEKLPASQPLPVSQNPKGQDGKTTLSSVPVLREELPKQQVLSISGG